MSDELTGVQQRMLDAIADFWSVYGYAPSVEELRVRVGLESKSTVHAHIQSLVKKGYVKSEPRKIRTIRLAS